MRNWGGWHFCWLLFPGNPFLAFLHCESAHSFVLSQTIGLPSSGLAPLNGKAHQAERGPSWFPKSSVEMPGSLLTSHTEPGPFPNPEGQVFPLCFGGGGAVCVLEPPDQCAALAERPRTSKGFEECRCHPVFKFSLFVERGGLQGVPSLGQHITPSAQNAVETVKSLWSVSISFLEDRLRFPCPSGLLSSDFWLCISQIISVYICFLFLPLSLQNGKFLPLYRFSDLTWLGSPRFRALCFLPAPSFFPLPVFFFLPIPFIFLSKRIIQMYMQFLFIWIKQEGGTTLFDSVKRLSLK